ncbi:hypothetical protein ACFY78_36570 [Streptomyces olindensis]|uniref:hypothetical protein n=1 Tax=Streptomyces olindensis TaxID=358823 RepID=UPI0036AF3DEB
MRKLVDHVAVAARCRANPGEWQEVGEYNSTQSADGMVRTIRTAYVRSSRARAASPYSPAGAFEATRVLTEFGARVEARYVGSDDEAWNDAVAALTAAPATRREYLLAAVKAYGGEVTTQVAEELMADSPWPTAGRNTLRKDLRSLARDGRLTAQDRVEDGRRAYRSTALVKETTR